MQSRKQKNSDENDHLEKVLQAAFSKIPKPLEVEKVQSSKSYQNKFPPRSTSEALLPYKLLNLNSPSNAKSSYYDKEHLRSDLTICDNMPWHFEDNNHNGYAGSRFHNPPNPNALPKPPLHWIDNSSLNHVLHTAYLDSIAVDLKGLLHVQA